MSQLVVLWLDNIYGPSLAFHVFSHPVPLQLNIILFFTKEPTGSW